MSGGKQIQTDTEDLLEHHLITYSPIQPLTISIFDVSYIVVCGNYVSFVVSFWPNLFLSVI